MVDPIAASALAAFGLERSFQLVSFLLLKHRSTNKTWIDDLAAGLRQTTSAPLDRAQSQRLAAWLGEAPIWDKLLRSAVPTDDLVNDLADAVYLSHEPRQHVDLNERLASNRGLAVQLLTDVSVAIIRDTDSATAATILSSKINQAQAEIATQFLHVLADDNVVLLNAVDSNHRELVAAFADLVPVSRSEPRRVEFYPKPANVQVVDTGLLDELGPPAQAAGTVVALIGSNGTGKTFHAQQYAAETADNVDILWWVRASERAVAELDLLELSKASGGEIPGNDPRSVVSYLSTTDRAWMLVFDNAGPPREINELIPTGSSGTVLITTNHEDWSDHATAVPVKVWNQQQATEYLLSHAIEMDQAERDAAARIADALGQHPLACAQAARFCAKSKLRLSRYEQLLADASESILDADLAIPPDYDRTVLWAWAAAVDAIEATLPDALHVLDAFSWFASDPLPWDALTTTEADGVFPSATPTAALASALAEISLLEQGHSTVSCHRLIQTATRILHTKGNPDAGLRAAGDLLIAAKPPDMSTVERRHRFAQLLPHGLSVVRHAGEHQIWPEAVHLAFNFVVFLRSEGQLQAAHELALEAALLSERLPQIEPADELVWKRHIALSYEDIGDEARAIELLQQALDLLIDKLDPLDHVVLVSQVELGRLLAMGTEHERALTLHKSALGGLIETRGTDSDDAMDARRWLAVTERRAGNPHRAVALHEQIEDWYERTGGRGALSRLINRSTMVMALTDASRLNEAVGLGALTVDEATATLGPEHSETLAALDNLARAQLRTGGVDAAVAARTLVLDTRERELPDGHPLLLQARANLATAYTDANRIDDALSIERENVALFETHYGPDHPATWTSQNNLASTLVRVGEEVEATRILESVVGRRRDALGEDHPSTLLAEYNYLYSSGAHHQRYRALIQRMADTLGDDAFLTCTARCSYAEMLLDAGDHQTATEEVKIVRELAPNNDLRSRAQSIIDQATQN